MTLASTHRRTAPRRVLHDGWSVEATAGPVAANVARRSVAASVPGSIHTDLLAAGLIPDPFLDDNERLVAWIGACDWRYTTVFDWSDDGAERVDLVFAGLDTIATVELNGEHVAETRNMHRTYRFDVRALLHEGGNTLILTFSAPVPYADRASLEQGYRPHVNHHPYNSIRKMACNYGWDWGIDVATVGIWRSVTLESWSTARLAAVRPVVTVDGDSGRVEVNADVEWADAGEGSVARRVDASVGGIEASVDIAPGQTRAVLALDVPEADRWWPVGHGAQALYDLEVRLVDDDDGVSDDWRGRIGFRSIRLDTVPDADGTPFTFVVNDRPIFVKGANWIPDDAFVHRVDRARYAERIDQAVDANINLLRVWGGGIYEADDFYDLCDERGLLTWQDFLFACAAYTEDEPMRTDVEAEVRDNIARVMSHPSLALWNGSNENIWGYDEWGWGPRLGDRSWGLGYYLDLLPRLVAELDPGRSYTPSSPWSPGDIFANDAEHGSMHLWEQWNRQDYLTYRDVSPRFVGEFGWQGPPTWTTLTASIGDDPLTPESPGMLVHQKAQDGNVKLIDGLIAHLPLPDDMADWHWAMSLNQAVAVRFGIEHFRSLAPHCMGTVVWQLNDDWPVTSWAAIDHAGRPKPLFYAMRHAYADRLVTVQPREDELIATLHNDTDAEWSGTVVIQRLSYAGDEVAREDVPVSVSARGAASLEIPADVATAGDAASELIAVTVGGVRGLWFFAEYRDSALAAQLVEASVTAVDGGYEVAVTAGGLVRELALLVDRVSPDARIDDQLVTLLPGETRVFRVTSPVIDDPAGFVAPDVLRSANQLVAS